MTDPVVTYGKPDTVTPVELRSKEMDLEWGVLGRFFGSHTKAPTNIAGVVALLLVTSGVGLVVWQGWQASAEYWKVMTPVLTLVLGFLFGKNS
jgi:hypothetical protein